jgi:ABC-2 type transport system permease protein
MSTQPAPYVHAKRSVIRRFTVKRTLRGAAIWGLIFGLYVASKTIAFATLSSAARAKLATSFGNNVGLNVLLGRPVDIGTVAGYCTWVCISVMMIIGSIWAFMLVTKNLRGEETDGRWELFLSGRYSPREVLLSVLSGLTTSLLFLFVIAALCFTLIGHDHVVHFGAQAAVFFAMTAIAGAAEFLAFGALASQLMPTRSRAAGLSAGFFAVCFFLKAVADATTAVWVLNITPLGWIEKLHPLVGSSPVWLIPIAGFIAVCTIATVVLAGRRDLGDSVVSDKDTAEPKTQLLFSPFGLAIRLLRTSIASWVIGVSLMALFYGFLTKAAAQAFNEVSLKAQSTLGRIIESSQQHTGAILYLSIVFLLIMIVLMVYAANALGAIREDEAAGHLDNLFVRPISRTRWLVGRIVIVASVIVVASLATTLCTWLGMVSQHTGISLHSVLIAGLNTIAPAVFVLGIGILAFALVPRFTTFVVYGIIAWSFLILMLSSGLSLNHWFTDTSVLQHVPLAPAANPDWTAAGVLIVIALVASIIGAAIFKNRDLQSA